MNIHSPRVALSPLPVVAAADAGRDAVRVRVDGGPEASDDVV